MRRGREPRGGGPLLEPTCRTRQLVGRTRKPFNPLLGETYELVESGSDGGGIRHLSEQVGHHPPMTAFHCESLRHTRVRREC